VVGRSVHGYVKTQTSCATVLTFDGMSGGNLSAIKREKVVNAIETIVLRPCQRL
jgi:hypothetical protein